MSSMIMKSSELAELASHPEYGCTPVGSMLFSDLREPEQMPELIESIKLHGIKSPIIIEVHESGEQIVADGHHRALAALHLQLDEVPVLFREL